MERGTKQALFFYLEGEEFFPQREITRSIVHNCFKDKETTPDLIEQKLPFVSFSHTKEAPSIFTIDCLGFYRSDVTKFLYEMISRWLVPGQKLVIEAFSVNRFKFFEIEKEIYFSAKVVISIETQNQLALIEYNEPTITKEIKLGLESFYHAKRILEIKGLSIDEKTSYIQEKITALIHRFPQQFDYDLYPLMQKFLLESSEEYKKGRGPDLLAQVIYTLYVFMHRLQANVEEVSRKRHLFLKVIRSKIQTLFGEKNVIGFFVGVNFLKENEIFDKRHLIKAVQKHFSEMEAIDSSYFGQSNDEERLSVFYIEMKKEGVNDLTDQDIRYLRKELEKDLKGCIESLVRPVFMPRNEEEVMKYIVTLSGQIKVVRDLPQVVISFDEQTDRDLFFTIILVRPFLPDTPILEEILQISGGMIEIGIEKVKQVGFIRKRIPKQAAILKVRLSNLPFLRDDFVVDLYKARQKIVKHLTEILGEIRDYNGGMIAKQMEVFLSFEQIMKQHGEQNHYLLENFFHSLYPVESRSVVHIDCLKIFFLLFRNLLHSDNPSLSYLQKSEKRSAFICLKIYDFKRKKTLLESVQKLKIPNSQLVQLLLSIQDTAYVGFIYFSDSKEEQKTFLAFILNEIQK